MKELSPAEIECLLGIRKSDDHPLDIFGYGFTTEGARQFRAERPNFFPQIAAYVRCILARDGIFPSDTNFNDLGCRTFIQADGAAYRISSVEEICCMGYERIITDSMPESKAIHEYIRKVTNPDYIHPNEEG